MNRLKHVGRVLRQPFQARQAFRRLDEYHVRPRTLEEAMDWAMNFGGSGYMRVKTLQIPVEILALARAVQSIAPRIILEIGTASGGTALIWSYLASERAITCDLKEMNYLAPCLPVFPRRVRVAWSRSSRATLTWRLLGHGQRRCSTGRR